MFVKKVFYKLHDFLYPENSGNKIRKTATIISSIYFLLSIILLFIAIIGLFTDAISASIVIIICTPIALLVLQIPIWFVHAFCDIYDTLCKPQGIEAKEIEPIE